MSSASAIAGTGLAAAALGVATSAHNLANLATPGFAPAHVETESLPGGGVAARPVPSTDPVGEARADQALLAPSRTDLAQELLAQAQAARAYRANLATLRTAAELEGDLLDALKR